MLKLKYYISSVDSMIWL